MKFLIPYKIISTSNGYQVRFSKIYLKKEDIPISISKEFMFKEFEIEEQDGINSKYNLNETQKSLQSEISEFLQKKNQDYGDNNLTIFGIFGILVRLYDKEQRLENLVINECSKHSIDKITHLENKECEKHTIHRITQLENKKCNKDSIHKIIQFENKDCDKDTIHRITQLENKKVDQTIKDKFLQIQKKSIIDLDKLPSKPNSIPLITNNGMMSSHNISTQSQQLLNFIKQINYNIQILFEYTKNFTITDKLLDFDQNIDVDMMYEDIIVQLYHIQGISIAQIDFVRKNKVIFEVNNFESIEDTFKDTCGYQINQIRLIDEQRI